MTNEEKYSLIAASSFFVVAFPDDVDTWTDKAIVKYISSNKHEPYEKVPAKTIYNRIIGLTKKILTLGYGDYA